jgi:hypothetical protein
MGSRFNAAALVTISATFWGLTAVAATTADLRCEYRQNHPV